MHSFINFTVLGIEVIKVFRKIITLRIRNQKELGFSAALLELENDFHFTFT